jgi:predicted anti-sigma-YlaC factor YlaD
MHQTIQDGLEDYLAGTAGRADRSRIEAHLVQCSECRQEVDLMREMSEMFSSLRSPDPPQPSPGFYSRVTQLIEKQQPEPTFWAAVMEPVFGRRLALASLLVLATLGTVLMSRETEYATGPTPEMILAVERAAPPEQASPLLDRDQMLYTLASHTQ